MKKLYYLLSLMIIPSVLILYSWSPGGSPGGKSGSPGDGGATCTDCHGGTATEQVGWITTNIPAEGFTPGETYIITATGTQDGVSKFGFELTAENSDGDKLGGLTITDADRTRFTNSDNAVTHTAAGNVPDGNMNSWSMEWTAPDEDIGSVSFYAAFNASMGSNVYNIYTSSLDVSQSTTGVADDLLAARINVYPNPASDQLNIDLPEGAELRIIDMVGHELMVNRDTRTTERIDLSGLKEGIYFVQILHEGAQATKRIIKN
jgi:hypothetical protein